MSTDEDMRSYATSLGSMTEDELFREMKALEKNSDAASKKRGDDLDEVLARIVIVEQEIEQVSRPGSRPVQAVATGSYLGFESIRRSVSHNVSEALLLRNFLTKIYPDRQKQIEFVRMMGHSVRSNPNVAQSAKPMTVSQYIRAEIAAVSPVFITFQTCGTKLATEHTEAR